MPTPETTRPRTWAEVEAARSWAEVNETATWAELLDHPDDDTEKDD